MNDAKLRAETAADRLLEARRSGPIAGLPDDCRPRDLAEAYAVQDAVARALGPVGGWKVGATAPDAAPNCAPLPADTILDSPASLGPEDCRLRGVEPEIAFRLARDLPAGAGRDEALAAIESAHPAIEVCDSRFREIEGIDEPSKMADGNYNCALVLGPAWDGWRELAIAEQLMRLVVNGEAVAEGRGGNTAGDLIRLLVWLADHAAGRGMPLRRGQVITTGSWAGLRFVPAGAEVEADFPGIGQARVAFA